MKLVLDASVVVASERVNEPGHAASRALIDRALRDEASVVVPALFRIEAIAALARRGHDAAAAERLVDALTRTAETVTIGPRRAALIARFAARFRLRAADACYAWLASQRGLVLVTLDAEMIKLAPAIPARLP